MTTGPGRRLRKSFHTNDLRQSLLFKKTLWNTIAFSIARATIVELSQLQPWEFGNGLGHSERRVFC